MRMWSGVVRVGVLALAVAAIGLSGLASDKAADNAKAYQADLEAMKGSEPPAILNKLADWKFDLMGAWMAENPSPKEVSKHDIGKVKFSKQEVQDIFGSAGKYKVAVYGKVVGTNQVTTGTVDQTGSSFNKDLTVDLQVFTVVRLVFKDEKLTNVRIWPKLELSGVSGGTWYIRHIATFFMGARACVDPQASPPPAGF
ncbi:MAG TPA: hypothetical protein VMS75_03905 [Terriglobales bacterium]|nr:hypothetical protein [Terriglobales bacterium]